MQALSKQSVWNCGFFLLNHKMSTSKEGTQQYFAPYAFFHSPCHNQH